MKNNKLSIANVPWLLLFIALPAFAQRPLGPSPIGGIPYNAPVIAVEGDFFTLLTADHGTVTNAWTVATLNATAANSGVSVNTNSQVANGGVRESINYYSAAHTLNTNEVSAYYNGTNSVLFTLEDATTCKGQRHSIGNITTNQLIFTNATGAQTIAGLLSITNKGQYQVSKIISDGTNWQQDVPAGNTLGAGSGIIITQSGSTLTIGTNGAGGGSGTVTSVTFTGDGIIDSSTPSSAVTTSGTVTATPLAQIADSVLANNTGSTANPAFVTNPIIGSQLILGGSTNGGAVVNSNNVTVKGALIGGQTAFLDSAQRVWVENWTPKSSSSFNGNLSWNNTTVGTAPTVLNTFGDSNHMSILQVTCGATAGAHLMTLGDTPGLGRFTFPGLGKITGWTNVYWFQLSTTNGVMIMAGFTSTYGALATNAEPASWFGMRYNSAVDNSFMAVARTNNVSTTNTLGISADTSWHKMTVWCSGIGVMNYQIDSNASVQINSNVTTAALDPFYYISTATGGSSPAVSWDEWITAATGMNR